MQFGIYVLARWAPDAFGVFREFIAMGDSATLLSSFPREGNSVNTPTHSEQDIAISSRQPALNVRRRRAGDPVPTGDVRCEIVLMVRSRLNREGLKVLLGGSAYRVVAEARNLEEIRDILAERIQPGIVLLATEFHDFANKDEFVAQLREIRLLVPDSRILVLSDSLCMDQLVLVLANGADGYLLKDITPLALRQSLSLALAGEKILPTKLVSILVADSAQRSRAAPSATACDSLTGREKDILACLVAGHPNKLIGRELGITEGTVKVHLKGVLKKINVQNRTQAAIWAANHGYGGFERTQDGPTS